MTDSQTEQNVPPVYIVSGSSRGVGEQLVQTILAQFRDVTVPVKTLSCVRELKEIKEIVAEAAETRGIIVHTLVDPRMRHALISLAHDHNVIHIDLAGPLISYLSNLLGQDPLGEPGLYRRLHLSYFKRIEAIEFTLAHDDGKNYRDWPEAEIVILGVSRVYKTPLSHYLAMLGFKVANVPIVLGVEPRAELYQLDHRRVVGLMIEPDQLLHHREHRQRHLGTHGKASYVNPAKVYEELDFARQLFRRGGFAVIDMTDKPIETSADEVVAVVTRRLKTELDEILSEP